MVSREIEIKAKEGLHARPASQIVQFTKGLSSDIKMKFEGKTANGKSIINILALGAKFGSKVEILVEGANELEEIEAFVNFMENI